MACCPSLRFAVVSRAGGRELRRTAPARPAGAPWVWGQNTLFKSPRLSPERTPPRRPPPGYPGEGPGAAPASTRPTSWTPCGPPLFQRTARAGLPPRTPAPHLSRGPASTPGCTPASCAPEQRKVTEEQPVWGSGKADVRRPGCGEVRTSVLATPAPPPHWTRPPPGGPGSTPVPTGTGEAAAQPRPEVRGQAAARQECPDLTPAWSLTPQPFSCTPYARGRGILEKRPREVGRHRRDRDSKRGRERDLAGTKETAAERGAGPAGGGGPGRLPQGLRDPQELGQEAWPGRGQRRRGRRGEEGRGGGRGEKEGRRGRLGAASQ